MVNLSIVLEAIDLFKISGDHINVEVLGIYKCVSVQVLAKTLFYLSFCFIL